MTARIDYTQVAAKLNYPALEKRLEEMKAKEPPKKRKQIGDVLEPITAKLQELHAKGWTYEQLAKELTDAGLPVKASALRDHLGAKKTPGPGRGKKRAVAAARV